MDLGSKEKPSSSWNALLADFLLLDSARDFISYLLGREVVKVADVEYEVTYSSPRSGGHGVRFDVLFKDGEAVVNLELQSYPDAVVPRSVYYSAMLVAARGLSKGEDYSKLRPTYTVFVCSSVKDTSEAVTEIFLSQDGGSHLPYMNIRLLDVGKLKHVETRRLVIELLKTLALPDSVDRTARFLSLVRQCDGGGKMSHFDYEGFYKQEERRLSAAKAAFALVKDGSTYTYTRHIVKAIGEELEYPDYVALCHKAGVIPSAETE